MSIIYMSIIYYVYYLLLTEIVEICIIFVIINRYKEV
jgi:hypothetical protein